MPGVVNTKSPDNSFNKSSDKSFGIKQFVLLLLVFLVFFSLPFLPALFSDKRYYGMETGRKAPGFNLTSHAGENFSLSDFRGNYIFLMFGYLNCDGLCHNQVMLFQEVNALLSASGQTSQAPPVFLYISMDPARDDVKKVAKYFDNHADNFISLNASDFRHVQALAMDYGAYFTKTASNGSGNYEIDHPGRVYLIDQKGNLRITYSANHKQADRMVSDLITIVKEQNTTTQTGNLTGV